MESEAQRIKEFFHIAVLASVCCIILGFLFFQTSVFQISHPAFGFVAFGLMGSITFATLRISSPSKAIAALILLLLLNEVLTKPPEVHLVLRDVLFTLALGTAVFVFHQAFYPQLDTTPMARPLVLGSLVALAALVITVILQFLLIAFFGPFRADYLHSMTVNLTIGFLVGIGLGVGFEVAAVSIARTGSTLRARNANGG